MSHSPRPRDSQSTRAFWSILASRPVLGALVIVGILAGAAVWRGLVFVERDLAPMVENNLQKLFNRPVKLGPLKGYSLTSIEYGRSSIPPHTTTLNGRPFFDKDQASVESVVIRFNPLTVLFSQTLNLDVVLNRPQVYLDQAPDNRWIATQLSPSPEGWLKIKVKTIRAVDATVKLDPARATQQLLQNANGTATFKQNNQRIDLAAVTDIDSGGHIKLKGVFQPPNQALSLTAQTEKLVLPPLLGLLPPIPVNVRTGQFDGVLKVAYQPQQPLRLVSQGTFRDSSIDWPAQSISAKSQQLKTDVAVTLPPNRQPIVSGNAEFRGAEAQVPEALILANGRSRRQTARDVSGTATFLGASQKVQLDLKGALAIGGQVKAKGEVKLPLDQAKLLIQAQNVPARLFDRAYALPLQVRAGRVGGNVTVQLQKNQRPSLQGIALLKNVDAAVARVPQPFLGTSGYVRFRGLTATLDQVKTRYNDIPLRASGSIDPDRGFNLSADTEVVEVNRALKTLQVKNLPFPIAGQIQAVGLQVVGAINHPILTGQVRNAGEMIADRIPVQSVSARFRVLPSSATLVTISDIAAQPSGGGVVTGQAAIQITPNPAQSLLRADLRGNGLSGDTLARFYQASPNFALGLVSGTAVISGSIQNVETRIAFQAPQGTYPTTGRVVVRQGRALLQDVVSQIKGGVLRLSGIVTPERVQLDADLPGLVLNAYSPDLRGALSGRLAINAPLAGFSTRTARAQGAVRFSKGLSLIQDPLNAQIRWNGSQILVDRASAPNFVAKGAVGVQLESAQGPQITTLNLNIDARRYDIHRLAAVGLPQNPAYGLADLKGRLSGTLSAPVLTSSLAVNRLSVSQLEFEPLLVGNLNFNPTQGLRLNLSGTRDRLQVALDPKRLPIVLDIRRDEATIIGRRTQTNRFNVVFSEVPLLAFNDLVKNQKYGPIAGLASGNFDLNLNTLDGQGSFAVERPALGRFIGERLTGQVSYAKGVGTLTQGLLVQGKNKFQLDATVANLTNLTNSQVSGRLLIAQSRLEDLIAFAKLLPIPLGAPAADSENLGQSNDVQTEPINLEDVPLWQQLQRLAEIDQLLAQRQKAQFGNGIIPDWQKLTGQLTGEVRFAGSLKAGLSATFDLQGQDWAVDPYHIDQFVAKGKLDPSGISLEPLALISGKSQASFSGRVGSNRQNGQLVVNNVPVESIADALDLPVNLTGQINGTANLSGQWDNPAINGNFNLAQGTLNRRPIQQANVDFNYQNARLAFTGLATVDSPDPVQVSGDIPYAPPFSAVKPASDQVSLNLSVKNQGLALANLFTDQVSWVDGKGSLDLEVRGTLSKPLLKGALVVQDATLKAQSLTEALTQVNGDIRFNSDRIMVKSLTGRYNQSALTAQGSLPIFDDSLIMSDPLAVALNNTALNLKGLYQGQASGNLNVTGSAFRPTLGGVIALQNGQVLLSNATNAAAASPTGSGAGGGGINSTEFKGLQVRLGDNVRILQPPVLSFLASGQINLNGSLDAPRPDGLIRFKKGSVNLFTSTFRIDQRKENFAQFTPTYGLDPYLNLSLRTTATEVAAGRQTSLNEFADTQPGTIGSLESVRIRANIQGRASQLSTRFNDVLELTSTPSRSQTEILALLSGGVSQSLQSGDAQGAIVNLASSAALNRVQSFVDDVLGGRASFRLFPVLTPTKDNNNSNNRSALELGAEFGYDVTDRLSVSLLQVVTSPNELPQINLSYDVNDKLRVRGGVNFDGDAIGIVEYRIRF
jgi:translocation and assembly module TamB